MVESFHVASGALAGTSIRSPRRAFALGLVLHHIFDRLPHRDVPDEHFEAWSGVFAMLCVIGAHGARGPVTAGALGGSLPDMEHVFHYLGLRHRSLFPAHRGKHPTGGPPTWLQLIVAGAAIGYVISARPRAA